MVLQEIMIFIRIFLTNATIINIQISNLFYFHMLKLAILKLNLKNLEFHSVLRKVAFQVMKIKNERVETCPNKQGNYRRNKDIRWTEINVASFSMIKS